MRKYTIKYMQTIGIKYDMFLRVLILTQTRTKTLTLTGGGGEGGNFPRGNFLGTIHMFLRMRSILGMFFDILGDTAVISITSFLVAMILLTDICQNLFLILSKCKQIIWLPFPLKSRENLWFFVTSRRNRSLINFA